MTLAKTVLAAGTRFVGQLTAEGDVQIDGRFEGGPLNVTGRLIVGAEGRVEAAQAEVGEAEVLGVFRGTLKARERVRLHSTGRVLGDILSPRVVFVSEAEAAAASPTPSAAPPVSDPPRARRPADAPPPAPRAEVAAPAPVVPKESPTTSVATPPVAAPPSPGSAANRPPRRTPPAASPTPTPAASVTPVAAVTPPVAPPATVAPPVPAASATPPAPPAAPTARAIPALPSLGQRSMQRLSPREP